MRISKKAQREAEARMAAQNEIAQRMRLRLIRLLADDSTQLVNVSIKGGVNDLCTTTFELVGHHTGLSAS